MSTLVKICGLTRPEQAIQAAALGADFIGVNFWPRSKRHVPLDEAAWLTGVPGHCTRVGVFVNPSSDEIERIAATGLVSVFQLHGDESPGFCAKLMDLGLKIIKAIPVRDEASLDRVADFPACDMLLDTSHPSERGGTGERFPWNLALRFKERFPAHRLWLAGGLTSDNVAQAVQQVRPFAVDVASGVESGVPGVKDMEKVARFIREVKGG